MHRGCAAGTIELREKELNLFNSNFSAVATQAALLAGFSMAFLESTLAHAHTTLAPYTTTPAMPHLSLIHI